MAKRRKPQQRREQLREPGNLTARPARRAPSTRRPPPAARRNIPWLIVSAIAGVALLVVVAFALGLVPGLGPGGATPGPTGAAGCQIPDAGRPPGPPDVAPLRNPPAQPVSDGTQATVETEKGTIVIELFCGSAPVAAQNFVNLATSGYYEGVVFHRIIPRFMIQGGDPEGTGRGGPGYTIPDEPVIGDYTRGTVAMARTPQPNSQGSQFFIVVADSPHLRGGGYTIFGRVIDGMQVADEIVGGPRTGPDDDLAADPVAMTRVTITQAADR